MLQIESNIIEDESFDYILFILCAAKNLNRVNMNTYSATVPHNVITRSLRRRGDVGATLLRRCVFTGIFEVYEEIEGPAQPASPC